MKQYKTLAIVNGVQTEVILTEEQAYKLYYEVQHQFDIEDVTANADYITDGYNQEVITAVYDNAEDIATTYRNYLEKSQDWFDKLSDAINDFACDYCTDNDVNKYDE